MAALFAFEIGEALRYLNEPDFYLHSEEIDEEAGKIWLGAADDTVFRKRGRRVRGRLRPRVCRHRRRGPGRRRPPS